MEQNRIEWYTTQLHATMLAAFSSLSAFSPLISPLFFCFPHVSLWHPITANISLSLSLALCIYILWDQPWLGRLKWTAVQSTRSLLPLCLIPDLETERERENTKRLLRGYKCPVWVALLSWDFWKKTYKWAKSCHKLPLEIFYNYDYRVCIYLTYERREGLSLGLI